MTLQRIGRFPIIRRLGAGGVGVVYEAYDETLGRGVAIKMLKERDPTATARLLREARALARVSHPNVVRVFEVGEEDGAVHLVMELVRGPTALEWSRAHPDWRSIVTMYVGVARGLAAAHAAGIVHRDIKPDNLVLGADGRARIIDFGLVRLEGDLGERRLTGPGTALGTPAYMSPEQLRGEVPGPASDQFSFASALHYCLFRQRPFGEGSFGEVRARVLAGERKDPPPGHGVPARVVAAITRALAVEPAARFASMAELADELEAALGALPHVEARRSLSAAALLLTLVATVSAAATFGRPAEFYTRERYARLTVLGFFGFLVVGVAFRRALLATSKGRRGAAAYLTGWVTMAAHRLSMLWFETPLAEGLMSEAILLGTVFAVGAVVVERWMAICAALAWGWAVFATAAPAQSPSSFGLLLASLVATGGIFWRTRGRDGT